MGWLLTGALMLCGLAMSLRVSRSRFLVESGRFHAALVPAFVAACLIAFGGVQPPWDPDGHPYAIIPGYAMFAMMGIGACWGYYWTLVVTHYVTVVIPGWWLADRKLRVPPSFDQGDAAMKAGEPGRALALYREELARSPDDPEVFLRLAGAQRALGASGQAVACLREAARCAADPHRKGPILLMLSEACGEAGAGAVLDGILGDPALADYHAAARRRMIPACSSRTVPPPGCPAPSP